MLVAAVGAAAPDERLPADGVVVGVLSRRRSLPPGGTLLAVRFSDELYVDFETE